MRYRYFQASIKSIYLINCEYHFLLSPKFSRRYPPMFIISHNPLDLLHYQDLQASIKSIYLINSGYYFCFNSKFPTMQSAYIN